MSRPTVLRRAATRFALFGCLFLGITTMPLFSQSTNEVETLTRLFEAGAQELSYSSQFQAAVSPGQLEQLVGQIEGQLGTFATVEGTSNPYTVVFEQGTVTARITLDGDGRITGLRFTELTPTSGTLDEAIERVEQIEGQTSLFIRRNGETIVATNTDEALAVGSSFKLAVLAAVDEAIAEGGLRWDSVVSFERSWRSLPSGILQDWPEGSSLTIETLSTLMISLSDNTATDALISIVGRGAVEQYAPRNSPFLKTAEAFRLKNPENNDLLSEYRAGSEDERRTLVDRLADRPLPEHSLFEGEPVAPDVEWFFTTAELADLIERLDHLDLMTVNPGVARPAEWERIAYKGGSEPGIMNLTTTLLDAERTRYTVSLTVNRDNAALNEPEVFTAYQAILNALQ